MMGNFFVFMLESGLCMAMLYAACYAFVRKETFFALNRVMLLSVAAGSFLLPAFCGAVDMWNEQESLAVELFASVPASGTDAVEAQTGVTPWFPAVVICVYFAGVLVTFLLKMQSWVNLFGLMSKLTPVMSEEEARKRVHGASGVRLLVHDNADIAPFSFLRCIVISRKDLEEGGESILQHELAHVSKGHSLDLILIDLLTCFQWFNPVIWILRRSLQSVHEYEADAAVVRNGENRKEYMLCVVKKSVGAVRYSIVCNFNCCSLRNRIDMMKKTRSGKRAYLRYVAILPVAAFAVTALARPEFSYMMSDFADFNIKSAAVGVGMFRDEKLAGDGANPSVAETEDDLSSAQDADASEDGEDDSRSVRLDNGNFPLIIVNGKEMTREDFERMDKNEVTAVTVLKNEKATSVYGKKGENGVIMIEVKK